MYDNMLWYGAVADPQVCITHITIHIHQPCDEIRGDRAQHSSDLGCSIPVSLEFYCNHKLLYGRSNCSQAETLADQLMRDSRVDCSLVAIGDGMALCRRVC